MTAEKLKEELMQQTTDDSRLSGLLEPLSPEQRDRAIALLDEWMADESGYDEETWPELKEALNRERDNVSARQLFNKFGRILKLRYGCKTYFDPEF